MEVERTARLQLADAARGVKQELDATVFEMASFRRAAQQSFEESLHELKEYAARIIHTVFDDLEKLPERSAAPLETVSRNTQETIAALSKTPAEKLKQSGEQLTSEEERLIASASGLAGALRDVDEGLRKMQTPESIIEIKLQPFIRGFTKAVTEHSAKIAEHLTGEKERWDRLERLVEKFERGVAHLSERSTIAPEQIDALRQDMAARLEANVQAYRDTTRRLAHLEQLVTTGAPRNQEESKPSALDPRRWWGPTR
jgi:phytoene/squalene synthetase